MNAAAERAFLTDHVQRMLMEQPRSSAEQLAAIKTLYENYGLKSVKVSESDSEPRVVRVSWAYESGIRRAVEMTVHR